MHCDDDTDQPPGICTHRNEVPAVAEAADRVTEFIKWFGDGEVLPADTSPDGPMIADIPLPPAPLYARDLESLIQHARETSR
jgi:hypothetical protein